MGKLPKLLRSFWCCAGAFLLLACTQNVGNLGGSLEGAPALDQVNQAGPVERPPQIAESDPIGDCSPYGQNPEDYEPEEVPENCLDFYEAARNRPVRIEPEEPRVLVRVYDEIEREEETEEEAERLTIQEQIEFDREFEPIRNQRVFIESD